MKKIGKIFLIIVVISAVLYAVYMFVILPKGFTNKEVLARSFFDNIATEDLCDTHFNPETDSFCTTFQDLLKTQTIVVGTVTSFGDEVTVGILVGGNTEEFTMTFIKESNSGPNSIFNKFYYKIDTIE